MNRDYRVALPTVNYVLDVPGAGTFFCETTTILCAWTWDIDTEDSLRLTLGGRTA